MTLSQDIREQAYCLGFTGAGFCPADDFAPYYQKVYSRGPEYTFLVHRPGQALEDSRPQKIRPGCRSVLVLTLDYARSAFPETLSPLVARIYQSRAYFPPAGSVARARLDLMAAYLAERGVGAQFSVTVPARWAGARAGVSNFGRNTFAYANSLAGSFIVIYTFLLDQEMEYGPETFQCKCPADCRACLEACPTGALAEPFRLNPLRCLSFNAWKTQPSTGCGIASFIPAEIRENFGAHVHGCDLCQEACPRNRRRLETPLPVDPYLETVARDIDLRAFLRMPANFFETRVRPLMYHYLQEPAYFQRNAAVGMGNSGDRDYTPDLAWALEHPSGLVRSHAAWALGKLGGPKARGALNTALARESEAGVRAELQAALAR